MDKYTGFEVAVIGISGRFPGANNTGTFWNNLKKGIESISVFSDEELLKEGEEKENLKNPLYVRSNSYLENKEYFDSLFFNFTPNEAKLMDPQMRILYECVWQAIEDAGYNIYNYKKRIGLFTGASTNLNWLNYSVIENTKKLIDSFSLIHINDVNFSNTQISYSLNLRGPSVTVNTACSTSLVAIHQACNSLILGECSMAVAGGITITNRSKKGYLYQEGMILSKDGHCRTFDEAASGTVGGEGVGIVVLKPLKKALEDNDNIYAIIKGTGINNDGNGKVGYTAPSVDGQTEAIMMARKMAKTIPESISYVEAHGTATNLGDPVEVEALKNVFGKSKEKYCALGSVKTNIGHLDTAAGVAGFIKTVLSIKHKQIPPSLHFKTLNNKISFEDSPFYVNTELKEWKNGEYPLRAGVSSFGIGGTNAHVILEEAPGQKTSSDSRNYQLLVLSAKTETALERNIQNIVDYLKEKEEAKLSDIAYTLQLGRVPFAYRKMIVCKDKEDAINILSSGKLVKKVIPIKEKNKPYMVFMFSGQGSQYKNMCYDLYSNEETFRIDIDKCLEIIKCISDKDFKSVIFSNDTTESTNEIDHTEFTQPALFIIEYSIARLLMKWGINPDIMIGHSIGEYVAACISGIFSLEDALKLVIKRGELMQRTLKGKMLSIAIPAEKLKPILKKHNEISLAAINSSELCVVSGEEVAIKEFQTIIEKEGYQNKIIRTSHAFHSHLMDEILEEFKNEVNSVKINPQEIPLISNFSGKATTDQEISTPQYWVNHLRQTVRFSEGIEVILEKKDAIFIEVGPGNALATFVRSNKNINKGHKVINMVRHPRETDNDLRYLLVRLGELWQNGVEPEWDKFYEKETRKRVSLPTYSFDKIKYPVEVDSFKMISEMISDKPLVKDKNISDWFYVPTWKISPPIMENIEANNDNCNLIFVDNFGLSDTLIEKFVQNNEKFVCVGVGNNFIKESPNSYKLDPLVEGNFYELFKNLNKDGMLPDRIIHAWAVSEIMGEDLSEQSFSYYCNLFFYSLINTIKAAQMHGGVLGKHITVLSSGLHNIIDKETIHPVKGLVLGLLKVIPQEFPTVSCKHIDILLSEKKDKVFNDILYKEIIHNQSGKVVSFRNSLRWVQTFDKVVSEKHKALNNFKKNGIYLISGGLGGVGLNIAKHLLSNYNAKVILLGRSKLPLKEEWEKLLAQDGTDEQIKERIKKFRDIEKEGGEVSYIQCNMANHTEVVDAVQISEKKYGSINGVIHAAGIINGNTINSLIHLKKEDYNTQFEPKIQGLDSLKIAFRNKELDFCLVTSSLSTVLGGLGFAAYASASAYMDYYIRSIQDKAGLMNWISVDLDAINFGESKTENIDSNEIFDVINQVLSLKAIPQVVVSTTDLYKRIETWVSKAHSNQGDINEYEDESLISNEFDSDEELTSIEKSMLQIWRKFFGKPDICIEDNFLEIGGSSLKALSMIGNIHKVLNVEIGIKEFFDNLSIKELSCHIEELKKAANEENHYKPIQKIEKKEFYITSSAQQRMLYEQLVNTENLTNNIYQIYTIKGKLDIDKLKHSFQLLINRHENLRTYLVMEGDDIFQRIKEKVEFELFIFDENKYETVKEVFKDFVRPFDLFNCPLMRCGIIQHKEEGNLLFIDIHHIVCDGFSLTILMNEFIKIYEGNELEPIKLRYIDYAFWQKSQSKLILEQKEYWLKQLSGELPQINMPVLQNRETVEIYEGDKKVFTIKTEQFQQIKEIAAVSDVSDFMVMLSAYFILLSKISGDKDLIIGTDSFGRTRSNMENIVGTFINPIPLRLQVSDQMLYKEFLLAVKNRVLNALDNQDYQYDQMLSLINIDEKRQIFDVYFSYTDFFQEVAESKELAFIPMQIESSSTTTRYELHLDVTESNGQLILTFLYSTALYDSDTIELFTTYFKNILSSILDNSSIAIENLEFENFENNLV